MTRLLFTQSVSNIIRSNAVGTDNTILAIIYCGLALFVIGYMVYIIATDTAFWRGIREDIELAIINYRIWREDHRRRG